MNKYLIGCCIQVPLAKCRLVNERYDCLSHRKVTMCYIPVGRNLRFSYVLFPASLQSFEQELNVNARGIWQRMLSWVACNFFGQHFLRE